MNEKKIFALFIIISVVLMVVTVPYSYEFAKDNSEKEYMRQKKEYESEEWISVIKGTVTGLETEDGEYIVEVDGKEYLLDDYISYQSDEEKIYSKLDINDTLRIDHHKEAMGYDEKVWINGKKIETRNSPSPPSNRKDIYQLFLTWYMIGFIAFSLVSGLILSLIIDCGVSKIENRVNRNRKERKELKQEIEWLKQKGSNKCNGCGFKNREDAKFCSECGIKI